MASFKFARWDELLFFIAMRTAAWTGTSAGVYWWWDAEMMTPCIVGAIAIEAQSARFHPRLSVERGDLPQG